MLHKQIFILGDKEIIFQKDLDNTCWLIIRSGELDSLILKDNEARQFKRIVEDTNFIFDNKNK